MSAALLDLSVHEAGAGIRSGRITATALTVASLERIDLYDSTLHAFTNVCAVRAMDAAQQADAELAGGRDRGPLHGIPYALKDMYDVAGEPTTCNSHVRAGQVASTDSAVAACMRDAGAILVGKLNMHEFGTGGSGRGLPTPPAVNPWNPWRMTGGSSSGAGVAVAAQFTRVTIGTDSGGSLRLPGAWCGGVGLKPTFGRVSRRGVFPLSHSLDHCGPLTRTVAEAAAVLQAIAGFDPADAASAQQPVTDLSSGIGSGLKGLRIGLAPDHFGLADLLDPAVALAIDDAAAAMVDAGASLVPVRLPSLADFRASGMAIMLAEAFEVHKSSLAARLSDYSPETSERLLLAAGISDDDERNGRRWAAFLTDCVDAAFRVCDVILTATTAGGADVFDGKRGMMETPRRTALLPFNLTGHPAIHVPTGVDADGMPVGVQLAARRFDEATLLRAADVVESASGWRDIAFPTLSRLGE